MLWLLLLFGLSVPEVFHPSAMLLLPLTADNRSIHKRYESNSMYWDQVAEQQLRNRTTYVSKGGNCPSISILLDSYHYMKTAKLPKMKDTFTSTGMNLSNDGAGKKCEFHSVGKYFLAGKKMELQWTGLVSQTLSVHFSYS